MDAAVVVGDRSLEAQRFADPGADGALDRPKLAVTDVSGARQTQAVDEVGLDVAPRGVRECERAGMEADGLVVRRPDPADGRRTFLDVTATAADAVERWLNATFVQ